LRFCYEAGPTGYLICRHLKERPYPCQKSPRIMTTQSFIKRVGAESSDGHDSRTL
jgi:hypothetical protein